MPLLLEILLVVWRLWGKGLQGGCRELVVLVRMVKRKRVVGVELQLLRVTSQYPYSIQREEECAD
jgi:hypothetical protein